MRCWFVAETNAVRCNATCVVDGRRPPTLLDAPTDRTTVAAWLATMSFHEAAAVDAFGILACELRAHGAPRSLLRSIARARSDEVRHARSAAELARRYGAPVTTPRVSRPERRSLAAIALENAREGCARETLGALIGLHQAEHAATAELRAFYRTIARDELRHAALSWRVHAWLMQRLPARTRSRVQGVVLKSLRAMDFDAAPPLRTALGLPTDIVARALRDRLAVRISRTPTQFTSRGAAARRCRSRPASASGRSR